MVRKRQFNYNTKEGQQIKAGLTERYDQITNVLESLRAKISEIKRRGEFRSLVEDVAEGLYQEIDKQFKKTPFEPVTTLTVDNVNQVILDTKEIAFDDVYVQRINAFEPAGDNPETRDVAMALTQVQKGLQRVTSKIDQEKEKHGDRIREAEMLNEVLEQIVEFDLELDCTDVNDGKEFIKWFLTDEEADEDEDGYFDYRKLCMTNFIKYFADDE